MLKIGKLFVKIFFCVISGYVVYLAYPALCSYVRSTRYEETAKGQVFEKTGFVVLPEGTPSKVIEYTGFTVSFNRDFHLPNYVVWTLTKDRVYTNVVGKRQELFAEDPSVEGAPKLEDFRRSGYDRGHMAPAADMKWSTQAQNDCFLMTNMAPQKNELNDGAWRKLEEKCRLWAKRDSLLIIVCGPVMKDKPTNFIGKTQVVVPESFFKVVFAPYARPPRAVGYIMPNGKVSGGIQGAACSVDDVEKITGYDFFPFIPQSLEPMIEGAKPDNQLWK